jgi:hypothetical protein
MLPQKYSANVCNFGETNRWQKTPLYKEPLHSEEIFMAFPSSNAPSYFVRVYLSLELRDIYVRCVIALRNFPSAPETEKLPVSQIGEVLLFTVSDSAIFLRRKRQEHVGIR